MTKMINTKNLTDNQLLQIAVLELRAIRSFISSQNILISGILGKDTDAADQSGMVDYSFEILKMNNLIDKEIEKVIEQKF